MPRLDTDDALQTHQAGNFSFTGTRITNLGATEYTLVTVMVDVTGSTFGFEKQLKDMLIAVVQSCQKSPRSDNLLVRAAMFSDRFKGGVSELHGFKLLNEINISDYPDLDSGGGTPLADSTYNGVKAMNQYAQQLYDQDFLVNGITFIITDGCETGSVATNKMVKDEIQKSVTGEILESHVSILIGINDQHAKAELDKFRRETGITEYKSAGDATPQNLAKLAAFVSQSVSSQSQALGTGGPSQNIAAVI